MKLLRVLASLAFLLSCSRERQQEAAVEDAEPTDAEILLARVEKDPKDADAWLRIADMRERAGEYQEEVAALERLIALEPENGTAYQRLGGAYARLGRYEDAVRALTKAAKTIRDQPVLFNNLAVSYGKLGKRAEQIAALEKAIALRPRYVTAHYNLGVARLRKGERAKAAQELAILRDLDEGAAASLEKEIAGAERPK